MNIKRRIVVQKDGVSTLCRPVVDENGQLKLARIRDTSILKSGSWNITLPEVVIYPGSFDYGSDWWWWDYMSGLISIPPPAGYSGYTGNYSEPGARPDYAKAENVRKDATVKAAVSKMLTNTKNDASEDKGRRERGFWVYYNPKTGKYYVGNEKIGEYVKGEGTKGSVFPGSSAPGSNGDHIPKGSIPVTFIHTHTPLTFETDCRREVGLSQPDLDYANSNNMEMIVIDYVGIEGDDGRFYIHGGHDIDDPTKEYIYIPNEEN